jgi:sodium-coupled neutral amino acid transporter 11
MGLRYFGQSYAPGGAFYTPAAAPVFGDLGAGAALDPKVLILTCMLSNAYIAHFNAGKFLAELKNPTMKRFNQVIAWSFGTAIALYSTITAFGFLTWGGAADGTFSTRSALLVLADRPRLGLSLSLSNSLSLQD